MFMLRNRRTNLVRKIWRESCNEELPLEVKAQLSAVLKRLREPVLEDLLEVVRKRGQYIGNCCPVPNGRLGRHGVTPLQLMCRIWRWAELAEGAELVRLPVCKAPQGAELECCNPYHWARLASPDLFLCSNPLKGTQCCDNSSCYQVPYEGCYVDLNQDIPGGRGDGGLLVAQVGHGPHLQKWEVVHSAATGGTNNYSNQLDGDLSWCTLAYWEEQTRVGRLFSVSKPNVEIFTKLPRPVEDSQSLCLRSIGERDNPRPGEHILKAREKIGLGVILNLTGTTLSVYNRSEIPLFVNSPTLEPPNCRRFSVYKVLPGYSMQIFDFITSQNIERLADPRLRDGPYDPNAVRLSFGKGWGGKYSRQIITSCPCWVEILLIPPR